MDHIHGGSGPRLRHARGLLRSTVALAERVVVAFLGVSPPSLEDATARLAEGLLKVRGEVLEVVQELQGLGEERRDESDEWRDVRREV